MHTDTGDWTGALEVVLLPADGADRGVGAVVVPCFEIAFANLNSSLESDASGSIFPGEKALSCI